jgi:DNA-binding MarR family transcriptional regulator
LKTPTTPTTPTADFASATVRPSRSLPQEPASQGSLLPDRRWLPTVRLLSRCFQAFERISDLHVRTLGLTGPQFDIIATLGNTQGMTCGELGERTLITKGTLTGVLDRLVARGLVSRFSHETDGRSRNVRITETGQQLFEDVFPKHLKHCAEAFGALDDATLARLNESLTVLLSEFDRFPAQVNAASLALVPPVSHSDGAAHE